MRFLYIVYRNYMIVKPFYSIISIRRTYTGLFEVIVDEPLLYRNTIQELLFHCGEEPLQGDIEQPGVKGYIGKPGLKEDIKIPGVKGDIGKPGVK